MFSIKPYGVVIAIAILVGFFVCYWRRKKYGLKTSDLEDLFLLVIPLGVVGARLYHVLDKWSYYSQNLGEIFAIWNGGLGIYGAVLGGVVGLMVYKQMNNVKCIPQSRISFHSTIYNLLDFLMPSLAIGQAIGRWGNFLNHEVFGGPTNLPWKWFIPENLRPEYWKDFSYFHPTFAYESLWVLIGFILLIFLEKQLATRERNFSHSSIPRPAKRVSGEELEKFIPSSPNTGLLTGFYAIWYGVGRFFFEFLRFDTAQVGGIKVAQVISLLLVIGGWWLVRKSLSSRGKFLV